MLYYDPEKYGTIMCMWDSCRNRAISHVFNSNASDSAFLCLLHRSAAELNLQRYDRIRSPEAGRVTSNWQRPGSQQQQMPSLNDSAQDQQQPALPQSKNEAEILTPQQQMRLQAKQQNLKVKISAKKKTESPEQGRIDMRNHIDPFPKPKI